MAGNTSIDSRTFQAALKRSKQLEADLEKNPQKYKMLTGDRPTGRLHIGHLFGSVNNRIRLQKLGVTTFIVIADYQVLTDRNEFDTISENVTQLTIDYIAAGVDVENENMFIFPHSHVPELNQLLLPFLTLVTNAELDRNPTVKEEIRAANLKSVNAGMYTYPVHQAADILFCKGNVVPVGKDQLPHLEITRTIAKRFNQRYAPDNPVFPEPEPLLSKAPVILGLDGDNKMSKSRNNAILLSATEDETAKLIKKAKTDTDRLITYDPEKRPEVANLILLLSLVSGKEPKAIAEGIGDKGAGELKKQLTEKINEYLKPIRKKRAEIEKDMGYIRKILQKGIDKAREEGQATLAEVRRAMNMEL